MAGVISWSEFEQAFAKHYTPDVGRPAKHISLRGGLQLLRYLENLSDEQLVLQFKRNPSSAFCGMTEFNLTLPLPCDSTERVHFKKRIGTEGFQKIFQVSVMMHDEAALEQTVNIEPRYRKKHHLSNRC